MLAPYSVARPCQRVCMLPSVFRNKTTNGPHFSAPLGWLLDAAAA
jgi:hypothetical protein